MRISADYRYKTTYGGGRIRTDMPETHFASGLDPMSNAAREGACMRDGRRKEKRTRRKLQQASLGETHCLRATDYDVVQESDVYQP